MVRGRAVARGGDRGRGGRRPPPPGRARRVGGGRWIRPVPSPISSTTPWGSATSWRRGSPRFGRSGGCIDRTSNFIDRSALSPRRHRLAVGILGALATAVAFDVWHAFREGPWVPAGAVVFGLLAGLGAIVIYGLTLRPLRLIRPAD